MLVCVSFSPKNRKDESRVCAFSKRLSGLLANSLFVHRPREFFPANSELLKTYGKDPDTAYVQERGSDFDYPQRQFD